MPEGPLDAQKAPRFDDSRHNGVCREVLPAPDARESLVLIIRIAQDTIRCHHTSTTESLDRG